MILIDKSAFAQAQRNESARTLLRDLGEANEVATCASIALEILYSSRNDGEHRRWRRWLNEFRWLETDDRLAHRAIEVQSKLARTGRHRIPILDLLIAATAELNNVELLHYDKHFDLIAEITGQHSSWILPRGHGH